MKQREFNALLNTCRKTKGRKLIDPVKVLALPEATRTAMARLIIRYREPVLVEFLTLELTDSWLCCMGYGSKTTSPTTGLTFNHTCEHVIK